MNKAVKAIMTAMLSVCFLMPAACNGGQEQESGNTLSGNIEFLVPMANVDNAALQAMADAYQDINRGVSVKIIENNGNGYAELVRNCVAGVKEDVIHIVRISQISQYYGTDRVIDFSDYLEEENGNWKAGMIYFIPYDPACTELTMDIFYTDRNGATVERSVDLLAEAE